MESSTEPGTLLEFYVILLMWLSLLGSLKVFEEATRRLAVFVTIGTAISGSVLLYHLFSKHLSADFKSGSWVNIFSNLLSNLHFWHVISLFMFFILLRNAVFSRKSGDRRKL